MTICDEIEAVIDQRREEIFSAKKTYMIYWNQRHEERNDTMTFFKHRRTEVISTIGQRI